MLIVSSTIRLTAVELIVKPYLGGKTVYAMTIIVKHPYAKLAIMSKEKNAYPTRRWHVALIKLTVQKLTKLIKSHVQTEEVNVLFIAV